MRWPLAHTIRFAGAGPVALGPHHPNKPVARKIRCFSRGAFPPGVPGPRIYAVPFQVHDAAHSTRDHCLRCRLYPHTDMNRPGAEHRGDGASCHRIRPIRNGESGKPVGRTCDQDGRDRKSPEARASGECCVGVGVLRVRLGLTRRIGPRQGPADASGAGSPAPADAGDP